MFVFVVYPTEPTRVLPRVTDYDGIAKNIEAKRCIIIRALDNVSARQSIEKTKKNIRKMFLREIKIYFIFTILPSSAFSATL